MGESFDERLVNLKNIINRYNTIDQQYISDRLSDLININYKDVNFNLSYRDLNTNPQLKNYLNDKVYSGILTTISDLKEYRALQQSLFQNKQLTQLNTPSVITSAPSSSGELNAQFNSAFIQQVDKNNMEKLIDEEKRLADMMQNEPVKEKKIKLFHKLTFAEIVDNLSMSTVLLFKQMYTLDIAGLMSSQDNYIYYGFIFIFIYVMFRMVWQELNN